MWSYYTEQMARAKPTQRKLPAWGTHEVCTKVPFPNLYPISRQKTFCSKICRALLLNRCTGLYRGTWFKLRITSHMQGKPCSQQRGRGPANGISLLDKFENGDNKQTENDWRNVVQIHNKVYAYCENFMKMITETESMWTGGLGRKTPIYIALN